QRGVEEAQRRAVHRRRLVVDQEVDRVQRLLQELRGGTEEVRDERAEVDADVFEGERRGKSSVGGRVGGRADVGVQGGADARDHIAALNAQNQRQPQVDVAAQRRLIQKQ